jgi:DNA-binding GntR family transcriptional regulator
VAVRAAIAGGGQAAGEAVLIGRLTAGHPVARQTAGKALALLEAEGLVRRLPSHGYVIRRARR